MGSEAVMKELKWVGVCRVEDTVDDIGFCVLLERGKKTQQVAVFHCSFNDGWYAIDNYDPFSQANVLSRGILGSKGEEITVASPIFKQRFALDSGQCLDDAGVCLETFDVRVMDGVVQIFARS